MLEDTRNDYKINEKQSVIWEHEDLAQVSINNQLLLSWSQSIFLVDIYRWEYLYFKSTALRI